MKLSQAINSYLDYHKLEFVVCEQKFIKKIGKILLTKN